MKELFKKETAWSPADPPSVNKGLRDENDLLLTAFVAGIIKINFNSLITSATTFSYLVSTL